MALVLLTGKDISVISLDMTRQIGSISSRFKSSSCLGLATTGSLEAEWADLENSGFPREIIDVMVQSRGLLTKCIYDYTLVYI